MLLPALRWSAAAAAIVLSACSGGSGAVPIRPEPGLRLVATTPAPYAWAEEGTAVALAFNRDLDAQSVQPRTLTVYTRAGEEVAGATKAEANVLRWHPDRPLGQGWYRVRLGEGLRARDGSEPIHLAQFESHFAVRAAAGDWTVPVGLGPAGGDPVLAADPLGSASVAWMRDGTVWVAEYDRDVGWLPGAPVDHLRNLPAGTTLLHARGSGAVAVAVVQQGASFGPNSIRLAVSQGLAVRGNRIWQRPSDVYVETAGVPGLHVDSAGQVLVSLVAKATNRQTVRLLRFDGARLLTDDALGNAVDQATVERVELSKQGTVAVLWHQISALGPQRFLRISDALGPRVSTAVEGTGPPRAAGFAATGDAWTLMPASATTMRLRAQTNGRWSDPGVELPLSLAELVSYDLDVLTLDWVSSAGMSTLRSSRFDRTGRELARTDLHGPAREAVSLLAFVGDADAGALAIWQAGDRVVYSRLVRGGDGARTWVAPADWATEHAPVPIERAVRTPAGRHRTYFTFVDDGVLATTFEEPGRDMPRPVRNAGSRLDGTLDATVLAGTQNGRLLHLSRDAGTLLGQAFR